MQNKIQDLQEMETVSTEILMANFFRCFNLRFFLLQESESEVESETSTSTLHPVLLKRASNTMTRGNYKENIPLKKRLFCLVKCVTEYVVSKTHNFTNFPH